MPDDLTSIPRTHSRRKKKQLLMLSSDHMYAMLVHTHERAHTPYKCLNYKSVIDTFLRSPKILQSQNMLFLIEKMILK